MDYHCLIAQIKIKPLQVRPFIPSFYIAKLGNRGIHHFSLKTHFYICENTSILRRHVNIMKSHVNTYNELVVGDEGEGFPDEDFSAVDCHAKVLSCQLVTGTEVVDDRCEYPCVVWSLKISYTKQNEPQHGKTSLMHNAKQLSLISSICYLLRKVTNHENRHLITLFCKISPFF